jgi:hypothetical protein
LTTTGAVRRPLRLVRLPALIKLNEEDVYLARPGLESHPAEGSPVSVSVSDLQLRADVDGACGAPGHRVIVALEQLSDVIGVRLGTK